MQGGARKTKIMTTPLPPHTCAGTAPACRGSDGAGEGTYRAGLTPIPPPGRGAGWHRALRRVPDISHLSPRPHRCHPGGHWGPFPSWPSPKVAGQSLRRSSHTSLGHWGCRGGGDIDWSLAFLMSCPTTGFNLAHNEGERQRSLLPQPAPPALMS